MNYKLKGHVSQAVQWTGDNQQEIFDFVLPSKDNYLFVSKINGIIDVNLKLYDYVVKGVTGEFYPYSKELFEAEFEPVIDNPIKH